MGKCVLDIQMQVDGLNAIFTPTQALQYWAWVDANKESISKAAQENEWPLEEENQSGIFFLIVFYNCFEYLCRGNVAHSSYFKETG